MFKIDDKNLLSEELIYAIFIAAFVGFFALANYFVGFSLILWLICMTAGFVLTFIYPRSGLYAIIFLTFIFERFFTLVPIVMGRNEYKLYPIDIVFSAVIAGILFQVASGALKFTIKKVDLLVFAFALFAIIFFAYSFVFGVGNSSLAFSSAKNYAFYSLFYFVTFILIDSKAFKDLAKVVFASAIVIIWFIVYGIAVSHGLWSDYTPLSTDGIRTLAFTHGFYLSMTLIFSLIYLAHKKDKFSRLLLILMPIWIVGILGSMMRHLWISLFAAIIGVIVLFSTAEREKLKKYAYSYSMALIVVGIITTYIILLFPRSSFYESLSGAAGMLGNRVTSIANTGGDESIMWRSTVWKSAAKKYAQSPIFGIGFGQNVSVEIGKYRDYVDVRNIHNSFLVLVVQMGIFGISTVVGAAALLSRKTIRKKFASENSQIASYACLGILLFQVIAFMFQPYLEANLLGIFFWINLGILRRLGS